MFNPRNILVATDFTPESDTAVREGLDIAERFGSTLHLVHVVEDIRQCAVDYCLTESEILAEKNKLREEILKRLDSEISRLAGKKKPAIVKEIRFGDTIDEIIRYEGEKGIDLVLTAPHRSQKRWWRNVPHLTLGLINKSKCETMVVK